jgi:hypothetical protein
MGYKTALLEEFESERVVSFLARKKLVSSSWGLAGSSYFYETVPGWETKVLEQDNDVQTVETAHEMRLAFHNPKIKTIFIPKYSSISKNIALHICRDYGVRKTIFFEVEANG